MEDNRPIAVEQLAKILQMQRQSLRPLPRFIGETWEEAEKYISENIFAAGVFGDLI